MDDGGNMILLLLVLVVLLLVLGDKISLLLLLSSLFCSRFFCTDGVDMMVGILMFILFAIRVFVCLFLNM